MPVFKAEAYLRSREGACVSVPVVFGCVGVGVAVEALRRGVVRYVIDWRIEGRVRDKGVVIEARRGMVARRRWLGAIVDGGAGGCSSNYGWVELERTSN